MTAIPVDSIRHPNYADRSLMDRFGDLTGTAIFFYSAMTAHLAFLMTQIPVPTLTVLACCGTFLSVTSAMVFLEELAIPFFCPHSETAYLARLISYNGNLLVGAFVVYHMANAFGYCMMSTGWVLLLILWLLVAIFLSFTL